ncbi:MAG: glycogen debranching protein GlgX [Planctomycetota bacterium]|nr:glycogen debranching protein GlgX [Planctomycetota bacterium]
MGLQQNANQYNYSLPYGAVLEPEGVRFSVFSREATQMRLLLYDRVEDLEPSEIIAFDPLHNRWGDIWSLFCPGLQAGQLYHFQATGPEDPENGLRFQAEARLIDPYAKALAGEFQPAPDTIIRPPKCVVVDDHFDWDGDRHLKYCMSETVIYELHVRGFTQHSSSQVSRPGTYLGLIEKIPYLKSLGVTAVELLPVHEFPIRQFDGSRSARQNYWGYDPLAFFAPHRGYAFDRQPGRQVQEFKQMVKALHAAGIEVILDVVFNHTCEGNELGPVLNFKGLANPIYYMLESDRRHYRNFSGCGNTVNGNHPIVREMIFHCLRNWVHNYHVDGFRFDLASILSRDREGNLVPNPPLVEAISEDPLLADTKIIAEAWDATGAYQVGSFGDGRWAEWNGKYRDDIRGYWRGNSTTRGALATRLSGSSDLYQDDGRAPFSSINFITSHDGFTLNDLVCYRDKHNWANGEENRDGENHNLSDNFGIEGPTDQPQIAAIRQRQIKNLLATLLLSQGVPMLVAGDEFRRTQQGNNNAYCQDNEISWMDWSLEQKNPNLVHFVQGLIHFRRKQPTIRRLDFLTGQPQADGKPDVRWFNRFGNEVDWDNQDELPIVCLLKAPSQQMDRERRGRNLLFLFNSTSDTNQFCMPRAVQQLSWNLFINTSLESPDDIYPDANGPGLPETIDLCEKSLAVFVS